MSEEKDYLQKRRELLKTEQYQAYQLICQEYNKNLQKRTNVVMMTVAKKLGFPDGTIMKAIRAYSADPESQLKLELVRKANFEQIYKEKFGELSLS